MLTMCIAVLVDSPLIKFPKSPNNRRSPNILLPTTLFHQKLFAFPPYSSYSLRLYATGCSLSEYSLNKLDAKYSTPKSPSHQFPTPKKGEVRESAAATALAFKEDSPLELLL
ncbi:hypothetical protein PPYR_11724 [Photinus pyralis]|uniref:Uncharacterized protein n=1 Tax=Photinus pyralis TaxID=7054 RepID=A0A5N4AC34_PHOPY|nr:hypothetical protein PPYR_11724 [Photinus pyralis]